MKNENGFKWSKRYSIDSTPTDQTRLRQSRLAQECAKLDSEEEKAFAEEGMSQELIDWPQY